MDKSAIEKIVELGQPNLIQKYGINYTDKKLFPVQLPKVETLEFHSLDGFINTLRVEYQNFQPPVLVNVFSETLVKCYAGIQKDTDRQRELPYVVQIHPEHIDRKSVV